MSTTASEPWITVLFTPAEQRALLESEVRAGLTQSPKQLPPKYFYDERGSELFDRITRLDAYYPTRTETAILEAHDAEIAAAVRPQELVEIGSGYSRKTRLLLETMHAHGGSRYLAFDVSEDAIVAAAGHLGRDYDWLEIEGVVGDFHHHLPRIPRHGRGLVAFLGSTIGNLHPWERVPFLRDVRDLLREGDRFLLGLDLVKDVAVLERAYNDPEGVTAEFNMNVLHVLNRELSADFPVDAFEHRAHYDADSGWIEISLVAQRELCVRLETLDLQVHFAPGEAMQTEISCKFTRAGVERALGQAGLVLERWFTDSKEAFALALAARA